MFSFVRKGRFAPMVAALAMGVLTMPSFADACTGIRLTAQDGGVVYGRSMEWGAFDLNSRVAIVPRGHVFTGSTPEGPSGKSWEAKYGVVALDMLEKDLLADGMNEAGLAAGMFYHPGFASYAPYDAAEAANTITAVDVLGYILTQYATIEEVKAGLSQVRVVPVVEEAIGIPVEAHWMVVEPSGKALVIEYADGAVQFFDAPLGVITNAPEYDWHITNLNNYLNLSPVALPSRNLSETDFAPLGAGSGMIGLPGDNTPPSRFVRAVAWTQTARPTSTTAETAYELFRILDNFNLPLGGAEGSDGAVVPDDMRSSTIWTSGWDLAEGKLYFHTQHNRRLRSVDLNKVSFEGEGVTHIPLDRNKAQDVLELTPEP
ncbi:linear amide C-N hydrolase [Shimia marina]|uniref:Choloylglycine hydrolase n=1 Tax=Shimia marina TaxID=321267 RepID=A0A0N7LRH4_9RHOB|nr:choloylglycine hydrolase family protein [Shimia marina]CUH50828.1 Choloylglycine hydrolase [Shimia marina]SFE54115.1 choloylglycine hydrolase [Shimia marina]